MGDSDSIRTEFGNKIGHSLRLTKINGTAVHLRQWITGVDIETGNSTPKTKLIFTLLGFMFKKCITGQGRGEASHIETPQVLGNAREPQVPTKPTEMSAGPRV